MFRCFYLNCRSVLKKKFISVLVCGN
jgi:hypothetical protein